MEKSRRVRGTSPKSLTDENVTFASGSILCPALGFQPRCVQYLMMVALLLISKRDCGSNTRSSHQRKVLAAIEEVVIVVTYSSGGGVMLATCSPATGVSHMHVDQHIDQPTSAATRRQDNWVPAAAL
ncbi:hypothetical protein RRG08_029068 [Elysia crispata]|uniref:Uncharacterized protein n=1 Tax=Elysia crispata TaxID=231223 RepID=A0AAE0ZK61_9GAST|nr:hypothetical protein RRG08_029068 [Elysia crispata]